LNKEAPTKTEEAPTLHNPPGKPARQDVVMAAQKDQPAVW
jgi:hypothetical protein